MTDKKELSQSVYFTTNLICNLDCVYCYEHDKSDRSTFKIEEAKRTLFKTLNNVTKKGTLVNFHGGEPFISFDKIRELCEWAWAQNFPERFTMFATSNGTLIHGEIKEWLYENRHRFIVGLSLDGTREMHNINRSNSFDKIDLDFFVKTWPKQSVKMTVSPHTIENLAEGIISIHRYGFHDIRANLAEMVDWSSPRYKEIYARELAKLSKFYLENRNLQKCSLFSVNFSSIANNVVRKWCGVGTEMTAIDIDGRSYPCHLFFDSVCGKDKSQAIIKIDFYNPKAYTSKKCTNCQFLPVCPTCYGANYISRGDIAERDWNMCELHQIRFLEVARFEAQKIISESSIISNLKPEERYKRLQILKGIQMILPELNTNES